MTTATTTTVITPVEIPFPPASAPHLRISAGGCRVRITPGATEPWVRGSYENVSGRLPLRIEQDLEGVRIGICTDIADFVHLFEGVPLLDISLGTGRPFALAIDVGASEDVFDFGGIQLTRLELSSGAGKTTLNFSSPNPVQMDFMKLSIAAGALEAHGLANAGARDILVEGGAAGVQLYFDGVFQRECHVRIATALAGVDMCIPPSVAAEVSSLNMLGGVEADAGFTLGGNNYRTRPVMIGEPPILFVHNTTTLGGLRLRTPGAPMPV